MSIENSIYLRNTIIELLRKELPFLKAKAHISQEDIAEKNRHISPNINLLRQESEKCPGQHSLR